MRESEAERLDNSARRLSGEELGSTRRKRGLTVGSEAGILLGQQTRGGSPVVDLNNRIVKTERREQSQHTESLILAQDERWRRA